MLPGAQSAFRHMNLSLSENFVESPGGFQSQPRDSLRVKRLPAYEAYNYEGFNRMLHVEFVQSMLRTPSESP